MKDKNILIAFNNSDTVFISGLAIAGLRAAHYAARDMIDNQSDYMQTFETEVKFGMSDIAELNDFMNGNMNWAEIAVYANDLGFSYLLGFEKSWGYGDYEITFEVLDEEPEAVPEEPANEDQEITPESELEYHYVKITKTLGDFHVNVYFLGSDTGVQFEDRTFDSTIALYGKQGYRIVSTHYAAEGRRTVYMEKTVRPRE